MASILPEHVVDHAGALVPTTAALHGAAYVGLYFSAHWCPPCRGFTPVLSSWYKEHAAAHKLKLVFVSSDREEGDFKTYFDEMAWEHAVPFGSPALRALSAKFKVQGIPTLVIVDAAGTLVCANARSKIESAPDAFPWPPKSVWEILGSGDSVVVDKDGAKTPVAALRELDAIGIYFSAHWCPPCRGFTPELAKWYRDRVASGGALSGKADIVFVSSDKSEGEFKEYLGEMPWKALPFAARAAKAELSELFDVEGIPTLVFIDKAGEVLTKNGRELITAAPDGFPWPPQPRNPIDLAVDDINDFATVVMFTDMAEDDAAVAESLAALDAVAAGYFVDGKPHPAIRFASAAAENNATLSVRKFLGRAHTTDREGPRNIRVTIVDVPNRKKAMFKDGAVGVVDKAELKAFVEDFLAGTAITLGVKD